MQSILIYTTLCIATAALSACTPTQQPPTPAVAQQQYVAQSVIVVFAPNSNYQNTAAAIEAQHKGVYLKRVLMDMGETVIGEFSVPKGKEQHFVRILARHPKVQSAERNAIVRIAN